MFLNVHVHALVLDGVFAPDADGQPRFHAAPELTAADVADVLAAIVPAVRRLLARRGGGDDDGDGTDGFAAATPLLAGLAAASVQGVVALGRRPGGRPSRLGAAPEDAAAPTPGACRARWEAFDLHAGLLVPAGQRDRLERGRYALRPPVTDERLQIAADGHVVLTLRHPWADGTRHLAFEPTAFLERLAESAGRDAVGEGVRRPGKTQKKRKATATSAVA